MFLLGDLVSIELLLRLVVASLLWVLFQHLIRFHPRGIEVVGAIVLFLGLIWWVSDLRRWPPYGLVVFIAGFAMHALGRLLYQLRRAK